MTETSPRALAQPLPQSGDLSQLTFSTEYRSLKEDPAASFYQPCLSRSKIYKRAVGFFRSSVYLVVGPSIVDFARREGKISLICSPDLSPVDIDGIAAGYGRRSGIVEARLIAEIDELLHHDFTSYPTRVLATLISVGALDIKIALRADRKGLYHEKVGIFIDSLGNKVSFKGSANETWSGWDLNGNFESIEVFCSWRDGLDGERVRRHEQHFDSLWSGEDSHVDVFDFPDAAARHLTKAAWNGLDAVELEPTTVARSKRTPLPHQSAALEAWAAQSHRGILEHATGTGKTFTAVLAIREHMDRGQPAVVLVPSQLLLEQWAMELRAETPRAALLIAGGGYDAWKRPRRLQSMTADNPTLGGRIVLAIMKTAATDAFRLNIVEGEHLLVVADEVHQIGSQYNSRFLEVNSGFRLGLSATPNRFGDPEGTQRIFNYFGGVVPPPITLSDAIKAGRLVEYEYYPHPVNLTATEADDWQAISRRIREELARQRRTEDGTTQLSERAKMLLIQRSRIAKKAEKKLEILSAIMQYHYNREQHWLIYCEDSHQLKAVMDTLKADGCSPLEYHSSMVADGRATMDWFKEFGGPLVSIRCLDEGVDIPAISHAIILASSQNPRQFIQRRGRVLRKSAGKQIAVIHDAIVVPTSLEDEPDQTSLLRSELLRSLEFAKNAINKMAGAELRNIATDLGVDIDDQSNAGFEED